MNPVAARLTTICIGKALLLGALCAGSAIAQQAPSVAAAWRNGFGIGADSRLYVWGSAARLGESVQEEQLAAPLVSSTGGYRSVAAGFGHALAVRDDATLYAWGDNENGQLGLGHALPVVRPAQVAALTNVRAACAGYSHSLALTSTGRVWSWGDNRYGQLGLGDNRERNTPQLIAGLQNVESIACNEYVSMAVDSAGQLFVWGANGKGQLGDGSRQDRSSPIRVGGLPAVEYAVAGVFHAYARGRDGSTWVWGSLSGQGLGTVTQTTPQRAPALDRFRKISAMLHGLGLTEEGVVWSWGSGDTKALGEDVASRAVPAPVAGTSRVTAIATGIVSSIALRSDGLILTWGLNGQGQLGDGTFATRIRPTAVVDQEAGELLDLAPAVANDLSSVPRPKVFGLASRAGPLNRTTLGFTLVLRRPTADSGFAGNNIGGTFAETYNTYVARAIPGASPAALKWEQLNPGATSNSPGTWSGLTNPIAAYLQNVAIGSADTRVKIDIMRDTDLSQYVGTDFYIGYGTTSDEMIASSRYRVLYTVTE